MVVVAASTTSSTSARRRTRSAGAGSTGAEATDAAATGPPGDGSAGGDVGDRRARRRERIRAEVVTAALDLAEARGWEHVTVDDIAAAVDMAPRTFFRYFPSKDDVLFTDYGEKFERLLADLAARPADEPIETSVREAMLSLAAGFSAERDLTLRKTRLIAETPSLAGRSAQRRNEWQQLVAAAVAERLGVDPALDLRAQVIASTTLAAVTSAVSVWVAGDGEGDLPALCAEALDLLAAGGRATPSGRRARRA